MDVYDIVALIIFVPLAIGAIYSFIRESRERAKQ